MKCVLNASLVAVLVLLSGCILSGKKDEGGGGTTSGDVQKVGIFTLAQSEGSVEFTLFRAGFVKQAKQVSADVELRHPLKLDASSVTALSLEGREDPPGKCVRGTAESSEFKIAPFRMKEQLLDAGTISFGLNDGSDLISVPKDSSNYYSVKDFGEVEAGEYKVEVEGASAFKGFAAVWEMPEYMEKVEAMGVQFQDKKEVTIDRNKTFEVNWDKPKVISNKNKMTLYLWSDKSDMSYYIKCEINEADLKVNKANQMEWSLSSEILKNNLPAEASGNKGQVIVIRTLEAGGALTDLVAYIDSMRFSSAEANVQ